MTYYLILPLDTFGRSCFSRLPRAVRRSFRSFDVNAVTSARALNSFSMRISSI